MITAVDTNVILDLVLDDREHRDASMRALRRALEEGSVIVGEVVLAELSAVLADRDVVALLGSARVRFAASDDQIAVEAGRRWSSIRRGDGERRIVADFLVGAHALVRADRLLTRDRGFYRRAFVGLSVVEP